jgi:hypothetical protein
MVAKTARLAPKIAPVQAERFVTADLAEHLQAAVMASAITTNDAIPASKIALALLEKPATKGFVKIPSQPVGMAFAMASRHATIAPKIVLVPKDCLAKVRFAALSTTAEMASAITVKPATHAPKIALVRVESSASVGLAKRRPKAPPTPMAAQNPMAAMTRHPRLIKTTHSPAKITPPVKPMAPAMPRLSAFSLAINPPVSNPISPPVKPMELAMAAQSASKSMAHSSASNPTNPMNTDPVPMVALANMLRMALP